ncbi:hypothetical protein H2200_001311 [Cladophialophora chaetospira]|uniref:Uncharacterized protein n=1 Tax=Cladophialophora chaetospira TaxID=386627 RepID=A0AA38XKM3_9EURO|nr:hypothetical protein H2200_001311 [Cladophialophora chaetospira]
MGHFLVILFVSLAGIALTYAEQEPVAHDRLVRRCENETHPWYYGNDTVSLPPWATGWLSSLAESQPTEAATSSATNTSSAAFAFSPEQTSLESGSPWSNHTAVSGTGQSLSSPTISPPFANTTSADSNTTPSPTASETIDATSSDNTVSEGSNTAQSNITTPTTGAFNSSLPANATTTASGPIWSASGTNFTWNGTAPPWGTGGPRWSNTSFPPPIYTPPSDTRSPPEFETSVITVFTVDITPAPITPSPVTFQPQELTLTATLHETITEPWLAGTGAATPSTGWSNSSLISALSGSGTTSGSGPIPTDSTTPDSFSTPWIPSPGNSNTTGDNSTLTATSDATGPSAASGGTDGMPTNIPSSWFWPNATHPTPCPLSSDIWRDWNWTAPTGFSFTPSSFPSGGSSKTAPPSPTSSDTFNGTSPETFSNTATPSSGIWFGMTTFSNGSVATTFTTQFGTAPAAASDDVDPGHEGGGAFVSTSATAMKRHIVIPPRRQAAWAYAV